MNDSISHSATPAMINTRTTWTSISTDHASHAPTLFQVRYGVTADNGIPVPRGAAAAAASTGSGQKPWAQGPRSGPSAYEWGNVSPRCAGPDRPLCSSSPTRCRTRRRL
jgi:hypothetical protein